MGYHLNALIAKTIPAALTGGITPAVLDGGLQLVPLTGQWYEGVNLGDTLRWDGEDLIYRIDLARKVGDLIQATVTDTGEPVAYVTADYFGGMGDQAAAVWGPNGYLLEPVIDTDVENTGPINQALRLLGVVTNGDEDEFDTVDLGRHRDNDWVAA